MKNSPPGYYKSKVNRISGDNYADRERKALVEYNAIKHSTKPRLAKNAGRIAIVALYFMPSRSISYATQKLRPKEARGERKERTFIVCVA
jgi:hypothetical protein